MNKIYMVRPGFSEPTKIYELEARLIEIRRGATMEDIAERLDELGANHIIIENNYPNFIDAVKAKFMVKRLYKRQPQIR